ncbi:MAG: radical SAM family heme chaperone HemW [Pseudomonadota bacterium]
MTADTGFGVYVHWPFCLAKCPYCDFNSHVSRSIDQEAWRDALLAELKYFRKLTGQRTVETVFFGGGTPSLMPADTVSAIIDTIGSLWSFSTAPEISLEANPTSVEADKFRDYASAGVNRVSMGVQALNDRDLRALGRRHTAAEAAAAFDVARSCFDRVSFDLIYARVGQTLSAWEAELGQALDMAVDHLSLYQLTIEEGTRFFDLHALGKLHTPSDDLAADMYELTQAMTAAAGMPAYEISNHARPGAESRHNLLYWRSGEWVGAGPGAHGRIELDGVRTATETERDPAQWLSSVAQAGHGTATLEGVQAEDRAAEYLLMAMRLGEGADLDRFQRWSGRLDETRLDRLVDQGLLLRENEILKAAPQGRLVLNRLLAEITI